jgi:hypothetical protein
VIKKLLNYLLDIRDRQKMAIALAKGGAMMLARNVDLRRPSTWEFSGFSQNGEDGILDVLSKQLLESNRYFIEIGSSDGVQNNSSWLVVAEQYDGLMIEGDSRLVERGERLIVGHSIGVKYLNMFVDSENIQKLKELSRHLNPDIFSLDIDGVDYYIAEEILKGGFRPKIFVVEYNSVYGKERSITVPYRKNFAFSDAHPSRLYYGVSIAAWRKFFDNHGYRFVTVDRKGVNAFFVDPAAYSLDFLNELESLEYAENQFQCRKFGYLSEKQFDLIKDQEFIEV